MRHHEQTYVVVSDDYCGWAVVDQNMRTLDYDPITGRARTYCSEAKALQVAREIGQFSDRNRLPGLWKVLHRREGCR